MPDGVAFSFDFTNTKRNRNILPLICLVVAGVLRAVQPVSNSKNHYGMVTAYVRDSGVVRMRCICI